MGPLNILKRDYPAARAEALRRDVPLFVDVWASWCHTCMSMKEYVLTDPALHPLADAFVWLALDSERAGSADFLARFDSRSLPTLWVIEPKDERPLLKWIGAATASELSALLSETLRDRRHEPGLAAGGGELAALWLQGNRKSAAGQTREAIALYRDALARSTPDWPTRPQLLEALSMRLSEAGEHAQTVALAQHEQASMPKNTARINVLVNALSAAGELPPNAPERGALPSLIAAGSALANDPGLVALADDRSGLYLALVEALEHDRAAAETLARQWAGLLETQAKSAPTAAARRVWDAHRVEAYLALGEPARAVPMLEQSEGEAPEDYNPPARLARVQLALGQPRLARASIDRALARCGDPRKLRLYLVKADVLLAAQDRAGARAVLEEARGFARTLKLGARYQSVLRVIERRVLELS